MRPDAEGDGGLGLMNAAVGILVVIPLLLLVADQARARIALERKLGELQAERDGHAADGTRTDQPPIITISDAEVHSFASGRADLSTEFRAYLTSSVAPAVKELSRQYGTEVVEIIGHTDGRPLATRTSNLDEGLQPAADVTMLIPGSNADLGLLRARSVARFLQIDARLAGLTFFGYSAGQTILPGGRPALVSSALTDDPARRRIEIRLRRSR